MSHARMSQVTRMNKVGVTIYVGRPEDTAIYCIVLYGIKHTAIHCNTLQHTAPFCNTLQRAAGLETLRLIVLDCINTVQHTATPRAATHCTVLKHTAGLKKLRCIDLDEANRLRFIVC